MPDTVSSTRYVEFDAPYLTRAMRLAGLTSTRISVVNAHGSDAAQLADAQGTYKLAGRPAGTWTPSVALTEFEQAYTANPHINAVLMPNDENGAPVITYLKSKGVKADTLPITGQDATLTGLGNVLTGYQCGTVYKPIYEEAQAAVALAVYLRAGMTPPPTLVNGQTKDTTSNKDVASILLTPEWVTTANMDSTVIADGFVRASQLCNAPYASAADCKAAGISTTASGLGRPDMVQVRER